MSQHIPPRDEAPARAAPRRTRRAGREVVAGTSLAVLGAFALWASANLSSGTLRAVGPGMLPRTTAVLVLASGVALALVAVVRGDAPLGRWSLRGPFFVCLSLVAFALTIRTVGLAIAGPVVVLVSGAASPESRPLELLVFALTMTALCVGLFRFALGLPIPVLIIPGVVII